MLIIRLGENKSSGSLIRVNVLVFFPTENYSTENFQLGTIQECAITCNCCVRESAGIIYAIQNQD